MSKVSINTSTLTAIGDAIREKTGKTDLIAPGSMPQEIRGIVSGGGAEVEPIVLTGDQAYGMAGNLAGIYITTAGNTISTENITNLQSAFYRNATVEEIPFEINCKANSNINMGYMFSGATSLRAAPKINSCKVTNWSNLFNGCKSLREVPDDYFDDWDFSYISNDTSGYSSSGQTMTSECFSLRSFPWQVYKNVPRYVTSSSYCFYYKLASSCYVLEEMVNLPVPYSKDTAVNYTSNIFTDICSMCVRLTNLTFETPNGQPVLVRWKNQTIDLSTRVGYTEGSLSQVINYNSGITEDKWVRTDADYQALKNDPDWFAQNPAHSRYNHDSAVATLNSLPDASAYLATAGGTNTIKFKGEAGSATDGGAINTLTEEEIAVATAKGWTVSFV